MSQSPDASFVQFDNVTFAYPGSAGDRVILDRLSFSVPRGQVTALMGASGGGKTTVLRYTAVQDVGRAIHPSYVEGQIQGGVAQGVGWAINEEYFYDKDGHLLNSSLLDYRMPTALDLPMIETVMVEVPNPNHPYGVRGVGEVPIVPPAAAMANALYQAIGVRLTELPMNPPHVLAAIWSKGK